MKYYEPFGQISLCKEWSEDLYDLLIRLGGKPYEKICSWSGVKCSWFGVLFLAHMFPYISISPKLNAIPYDLTLRLTDHRSCFQETEWFEDLQERHEKKKKSQWECVVCVAVVVVVVVVGGGGGGGGGGNVCISMMTLSTVTVVEVVNIPEISRIYVFQTLWFKSILKVQ